MDLTREQELALQASMQGTTFLSGPAGCGKTTVGTAHLLALLRTVARADTILVLTPQRTLQAPYAASLHSPEVGPGSVVSLATMGGLARRMVELFWPLVIEPAGFAHDDRAPVFLTLETAQYYMARLVRPILERGAFGSVTIDRNRLYSQILDNLNKSAAVGFPHTEIGARLDSAWYGDPAQRRVYADAQECATIFRTYCLEHNLLDFSLQMEIFRKILWHAPQFRDYLSRQFRHLIFDNLEEDIPVAHDLVAEWLADLDSVLLIADDDGGFRRFLGADPKTAGRLTALCSQQVHLDRSFIMSSAITNLTRELTSRIDPEAAFSPVSEPAEPGNETIQEVLRFPPAGAPMRFFPQMLDWVADEIKALIEQEHIPPAEITVLSPYLPDALRFSLHVRLDERGIPWRSHRPSRSMRDEPATRCLVTLAAICHPGWSRQPSKFDFSHALLYALEGMDLVRAQLLAEITYRPRELSLSTFDEIRSEVKERITTELGARYTQLRDWILAYRQETPLPLDLFLRRLFGEVLAQIGFHFNHDIEAARVAANLVESFEKFRQAMDAADNNLPVLEMGAEYLQMLEDGVIAAQYLEAWQVQETDSVLLAPAHTFLMMNRPVQVQFWLDVGSRGWWERLSQPLTQPYILSRAWMEREPGSLWVDADEVAANRETLSKLASGLLHRCRRRVYIGLSDLDASGYEQRGPLLKALWKMQVMHKAG